MQKPRLARSSEAPTLDNSFVPNPTIKTVNKTLLTLSIPSSSSKQQQRYGKFLREIRLRKKAAIGLKNHLLYDENNLPSLKVLKPQHSADTFSEKNQNKKIRRSLKTNSMKQISCETSLNKFQQQEENLYEMQQSSLYTNFHASQSLANKVKKQEIQIIQYLTEYKPSFASSTKNRATRRVASNTIREQLKRIAMKSVYRAKLSRDGHSGVQNQCDY